MSTLHSCRVPPTLFLCLEWPPAWTVQSQPHNILRPNQLSPTGWPVLRPGSPSRNQAPESQRPSPVMTVPQVRPHAVRLWNLQPGSQDALHKAAIARSCWLVQTFSTVSSRPTTEDAGAQGDYSDRCRRGRATSGSDTCFPGPLAARTCPSIPHEDPPQTLVHAPSCAGRT